MDDRQAWETRVRGLGVIERSISTRLADLALRLTPIRNLQAPGRDMTEPTRNAFEDPLLQAIEDARCRLISVDEALRCLLEETDGLHGRLSKERIALRQREALVDHVANLAEENLSLRTLLREKTDGQQ